MILVRNTFHLKFGKAKEAKAILDKMFLNGDRQTRPDRVLTDLTGSYYTLALEFEEKDLATWEARQSQTLADPTLRPLFDQLYSLVESGDRQIFNIMQNSGG